VLVAAGFTVEALPYRARQGHCRGDLHAAGIHRQSGVSFDVVCYTGRPAFDACQNNTKVPFHSRTLDPEKPTGAVQLSTPLRRRSDPKPTQMEVRGP
jgi:hypothetical protein